MGPGPNDDKEARSLNRVIRWLDDRIEYEADPRQAEQLIKECELSGAMPMATPGVRSCIKELEKDVALAQNLQTLFRASAARSNYLSAGRLDIQFAAKEVCRNMSSPTADSWRALKRIGRFLAGAPRMVYSYPRQRIDHIDTYSDTDWAGCPRTRKWMCDAWPPHSEALVFDSTMGLPQLRRGRIFRSGSRC